MELKEKVRIGIKDALSSRGKNKGLLKAKCPPMDTYGSAAWVALMSYSNPFKVGFGHILFMSADKYEVYEYIVNLGNYVDLSTFDRDGNVLRKLNIY